MAGERVTPKRALFICVGNSARSQMAEAFFNHFSKRSRASSAGTRPASKVSSAAVEAMREEGIDISKARPKLLTLKMIEEADRAITMGCSVGDVCPANLKEEMEDWGLEDPIGKSLSEVRKIRDEIKEKVLALLEEIESEG